MDRTSKSPEKSAHDRYKVIYRLIEARDKVMARAFDDPRRSTAMSQLRLICEEGILHSAELSRFSSEVRSIINVGASAGLGKNAASP